MTLNNITRTVRRPVIVTGLAYLFLTSVMTMFRVYDAKAFIGKFPLYPGSVFPVATQWAWHGIQIALTAVVTVGLFRGWRWARWLAIALFVVVCALSVPLRDVRAMPLYLFVLAFNLVVYALLFFAPGAKVYFSRSTRPDRALTLRGGLSTTLLVFAIFTAHSIGFAALWKQPNAGATWGSIALFLVPALVFSALTRWDLQRSAREIGAALLAVTAGLASMQVTAFIAVRAGSPVVTLQPGWLHSLLLTIAMGITGLTLAAWPVPPERFTAQ